MPDQSRRINQAEGMIDPLIPILFSPDNPEIGNDRVNPVENVTPMIKIDMANVEYEIDYWSSLIYRYVVGANPSIHVMEGFLKRI